MRWSGGGIIDGVDPGGLRAGDADRERVAERLRAALDEGRLNLHEYDERVRDAYAARTFDDLDRLLVDLPGTVPLARSQLAPRGAPEVPHATRRWVANRWSGWARVVSICTTIWAFTWVISGFGGDFWPPPYFWPIWVAAPFGVVLAISTISGVLGGEPRKWAARQARRTADQEAASPDATPS